MLNPYALEEYMRQRTEQLRQEAERARQAAEGRRSGRPGVDGAQMVRPEADQNGARIWRFSSFPAWSRGKSSTKSIDRGRL